MSETEALVLLLSPFLVTGLGGGVVVGFWVGAVVVGMVSPCVPPGSSRRLCGRRWDGRLSGR